jgi:hypothetical protein
MKMNSQSRSFVKQVQADLLALDDADLLHTVQQWINGSGSLAVSFEVSEDTYLALGYTRVLADAEPPTLDQFDMPGAESTGSARWHAPSAYHLRTLLSAMDANLFAQHIITIAFEALHPLYPEWYEGVIFNAHLANYLRRMREKTANQDQGAKQKRSRSL